MCLLDALCACVCRNRVVTLYAVNNNKKGQTYPVVLIIFLFEKVVVKKPDNSLALLVSSQSLLNYTALLCSTAGRTSTS